MSFSLPKGTEVMDGMGGGIHPSTLCEILKSRYRYG